jgi:hypothetical protein
MSLGAKNRTGPDFKALTGEVGKWIEADLLQEHYNCWLEDMVKKRGGDFDDKFYRHTLLPNVDHFL